MRAGSRRFGTHVALEPTDLDVDGGESLALIGPNGAGKSTLLSILAGSLEPTAVFRELAWLIGLGFVSAHLRDSRHAAADMTSGLTPILRRIRVD